MDSRRLFRAAAVVGALAVAAAGLGRAASQMESVSGNSPTFVDQSIHDFAQQQLDDGQRTFRYDTFGDEDFWGGTLQLHQAIAGSANGGVGPGVSPRTALAVGLKVDADALPPDLRERMRAGQVDLDDPAVTLTILKLNAVVGVTGFFDGGGGLRSLGIQCALCHSTVDNSLARGVGHRLDGWANRDLNVGAIVSLAPNLQPVADLLGVSVDAVRNVLGAWGPGRFDAELLLDGKGFRPDGKTAAVLIPPVFGLQGVNLHTWTGWGSLTYWNAFVANLEMHGHGAFFDPRLNDAARFPVAAAHGFAHVTTDEDRITPKLAALQYYQLSIPAPAPPHDSFDGTAADRGEELFSGKARCATCHADELTTEPGWNMHRADEIGVDDFQARRSPDGAYRTAPLKGLWTHVTGGFYHDGRFATLLDVVEHYDSFFGLGLTAAEENDVVEYLKSLSDPVPAASSAGPGQDPQGANETLVGTSPGSATGGLSIWPLPVPRGEAVHVAFLSPGRTMAPVPGDLDLGVFDVSGRRVARIEIAATTLDHGMVTATWDGKSADGTPVEPGIYFVRVAAPSAHFATERPFVVQ